MTTRIEKDPLGEKAVPADALYGIQTLRAVENYPISGLRPLPAFVDAVIQIKKAAALTHKETGRLDAKLADAIAAAATEVLARLFEASGDCSGRSFEVLGLTLAQASMLIFLTFSVILATVLLRSRTPGQAGRR